MNRNPGSSHCRRKRGWDRGRKTDCWGRQDRYLKWSSRPYLIECKLNIKSAIYYIYLGLYVFKHRGGNINPPFTRWSLQTWRREWEKVRDRSPPSCCWTGIAVSEGLIHDRQRDQRTLTNVSDEVSVMPLTERKMEVPRSDLPRVQGLQILWPVLPAHTRLTWAHPHDWGGQRRRHPVLPAAQRRRGGKQ